MIDANDIPSSQLILYADDGYNSHVVRLLLEEKKLVITGRADGCTCSEFGDYVMETITQMTK